MDEKIIKAKFKKNKFALWVILCGFGLILLALIIAVATYYTEAGYNTYDDYGMYSETFDSFFEFFGDVMKNPFYYSRISFSYIVYLGILVILYGGFVCYQMNKCALEVTNQRVIGKGSFGKRVDLPLNQISAIGQGMFDSISIATSAGRVSFWLIQNKEEVHTVLNELIGKQQTETVKEKNETALVSTTDELKKYKDLLDSGIITQEEFDAKKKQLLGL